MSFRPRLLRFGLVLGALLFPQPTLLGQDAQAPKVLSDASLQPRINLAIDTGIEHLLREQHRDGSWSGHAFGSYRAGPTAFTAYTLIESGISPESAPIQLALDYLRRTPPKMTYSAGALLLLLAEIGDKKNKDWAEYTMEILLGWESQDIRGAWSYPSGPLDLSNTQFVALGLWGAAQLGVKVPIEVTKRIVQTTIDVHQEEPYSAAKGKVARRGRSASTKGKIAGFHYFTELSSRPVSASMTACGIAIQRMARLIHGKKLGAKLTRAMDDSERMAMDWLEAHWSVTENFGHHEGIEAQVLFLLWTLERLGAYYESETIAGHPWYEAGARQILAAQEDNDGWGRLHATCYSLLFLSRASRAGSTGSKREARTDVWIQDEGAVKVRASGRMDIVAYLSSLDIADGMRVASVDWLIDGEAVVQLEGDANTAWKGERFPMRWSSDFSGKRTLVAVVHAIGADGVANELRSKPLEIECKWTTAEWMTRAFAAHGPNLLDALEYTLEASSEAAGQHVARAADRLEATAWIASSSDANPSITLHLAKTTRAKTLTLSHPGSSVANVDGFSGAKRIRVTAGKETVEHTLPPQSPAPIEIPLPKKGRFKTIQIEILEVAGAPTGRRGFAEIGLR